MASPCNRQLSRSSRLHHLVSCLSASCRQQRLRALHVGLASPAGTATSAALSPPRVLSIQSHIVHGNLGNKCAVFPLQLLGFEVDNISTVQYSHMGAGRTGSILSARDLTTLIDGLDAQGLLGQYTHVLTGWAAEAELLRAIAVAVQRIRTANPAVVYLCDPVVCTHWHVLLNSASSALDSTRVRPNSLFAAWGSRGTVHPAGPGRDLPRTALAIGHHCHSKLV